MIKVSDAISQFLSDLGLKTVFGVTGGASIHLMHSIENNPQLRMVACHHEQGASMAADGYARASGYFGCAVATSGPGATNLVTGILGCWCDSVPTLFITGQVATFRQKRELNVRQYGFQETDVVSMVRGITKYAMQVQDAYDVLPILHRAVQEMLSGRPGPVLVDIPDDIQRQLVDEKKFSSFDSDILRENLKFKSEISIPRGVRKDISKISQLLKRAERPILILGSGVKSELARKQVNDFVSQHQIPVLTTWGAKDVIPGDYFWNCGTFGTHGTRAGNFSVQNSDLIISLGSRLSTKETGTPVSDFGREAKLVMVDLDLNEINKFEKFDKAVHISVNMKVEDFLPLITQDLTVDLRESYKEWKGQISKWKRNFAAMELNINQIDLNGLNSIDFVNSIQSIVSPNTDIYVDTGCAVAWLMQGLKLPVGARIFHDCNNTAMGWALPASIGGKEATPSRDVICVVGDGSFMMNLQELSTLKHLGHKIKLFLIDNAGYAMVRQTEQQWLNGQYVGTGQSGLTFPEFTGLFSSFGFDTILIESPQRAQSLTKLVNDFDAFVFVIDSRCGVFPQVSFGFPLEDAEPRLDRDIFLKNMIVEPKSVSQIPII